MVGIICAIRGGPLSQLTIRQAIVTAKEYEIPIYFLYVVNLDFLERSTQSRSQVIEKEMRSMGEFICLKAQIEASREGVQAFVSVREGTVSEEIINLCNEVNADFVILGRPQGEETSNVFNVERLNHFAKMLESKTNAKVIFSEGE